jgi:ATP-dependent RNA helicase DeaD
MLVATDVAARGIDVNDLSHVIHFNLPDEQAYYTHRSGRTARAGKKGTSIAFINGREQRILRTLERSLGISFTEAEVPSASEVTDSRIMAWCQEVVDVETDYKLDEDLFEKTMLMFDGISKEELIAKFLIQEVDKLNLAAKRQLNYNPGESPRGGGGDGGGRRDRKRGGGRGDRGGDRRGGGRFSDRGRSSDRSRSTDRRSSERSSDRRPSDRRITEGGSPAEFRISKGSDRRSSADSPKKHRKGEKAWRNPGKSKSSKGKGKKK